MDIPVRLITIPPTFSSIITGLALAAIGYAWQYDSPDVKRWVVGCFGAGLILGFLIGFLFWTGKLETWMNLVEKTVKPQSHAYDNSPVDFDWRDENNVLQRRKLRTVTNGEFREIASKMIIGVDPSERSLSSVIGNRVAEFRAELMEKRLADWRYYKDGEPLKNFGWELTEPGKEFCYQFIRTTSPPKDINYHEL